MSESSSRSFDDWYNSQATPEQREFAIDFTDWLEGRRSGHMAVWGWASPKYEGDPVNTAYWWDQFTRNPKYYILQDDIALYEAFSDAIAEICRDTKTVVELGPGSSIREKTFKVLSKLQNAEKVIYEDTNIDFLHHCSSQTLQQFPHLTVETLAGDFTKVVPTTFDKTLIVISGCTVMNFDALSELFSGFSTGLKAGGYLLATYDVCNDREKNESTYTHPAFDECTKGIWRRAARDLPLHNLDLSTARAKTVWMPEDQAICFHTIFDNDMVLELAGKPLKVNAGHLYWNGTSYRRNEEAMAIHARKAGFEPIQTFALPSSTVKLGLFQYG